MEIADIDPHRGVRIQGARFLRGTMGGSAHLRRMAGTICGARTSDPVVALSFDDGPHPANTPRLLSVLAQHHARATFFLITEHARKHPQLVDEIRSAGHEIGLHGRRHIDLARASPWKAAQTIHRGRKELEEVVGARVSLFRPPYGTQTPLTYVLARQSGMEVIGWSSSPRDFLDLSTKRHVSIALAEIAPGGIILLHDGPPSAPKRRATVVGALLAAIAEREWSALDVGGLLFGRDPVRRFWFRRRAAAVIEEMRPLLAEEEGEVNPGDGGEHGGRPTDSSAPAPALPMRAQPEGGR